MGGKTRGSGPSGRPLQVPKNGSGKPLRNSEKTGLVAGSGRQARAWTGGRGALGCPCREPERGRSQPKLPGSSTRSGKELNFEVSEVKLKKGEPVDRALRRLKKKVDRENTLRDVRMKRHYEKPSETKRRKMKVSKFSAMLAARYADQ